ncbi:RC-LH1 core complex protein PufX [Marimonas sp. MJW-29]|uniref:RC-LH1 core complex protein PufX n=1 Tax=Sulfitobacter sediminis TaxID=3234186 RepID=A0ABV3RRZ9_9RHOB
MSDNNDYLRTGEGDFRLRADVLALMLKGAGYAALFCVAVGFLLWAIYGIGLLLPEQSKEADDPTPFSYIETVEDTTVV